MKRFLPKIHVNIDLHVCTSTPVVEVLAQPGSEVLYMSQSIYPPQGDGLVSLVSPTLDSVFFNHCWLFFLLTRIDLRRKDIVYMMVSSLLVTIIFRQQIIFTTMKNAWMCTCLETLTRWPVLVAPHFFFNCSPFETDPELFWHFPHLCLGFQNNETCP